MKEAYCPVCDGRLCPGYNTKTRQYFLVHRYPGCPVGTIPIRNATSFDDAINRWNIYLDSIGHPEIEGVPTNG